ncbi:MAG: hypothetical protein JWQ06_998, partial [Mucilaginibacter sp.]|nr:hypothetical protein [Mucilaginibacter sp.]
GITGTTFMTLFSHMIGDFEKENFSEPNLLSQLFDRLVPGQTEKISKVVGWNAHFLIGILFALAYVELWDAQKLKPTVKNGILLGGISGVIAIAVWKTTFKMHPAPPGINFKKYYTQLWVAHVVFAIFSTLTYQLIKDREEKRKLESDQKYLSSVNP